MTKITEKTWIPVSLLSTAGASLIGGVFWLSTIYAQGNENSRAIEKIASKQDRMEQYLIADISEIKQDVSEMKGQLKQALKK